MLAVTRGQAIGLVLHAQGFALGAPLAQDLLQILGRARLRVIDPDADVLDDRGLLRLAQVGRAGQERHGPVPPQVEALEEDIAEGIVSRQVEEALLPEDQEAVEAAFGHHLAGARAAARQFFF